MGRILVQDPAAVVEQKVPFTFESGTLLLQQVFSGNIIDSAWIRIDTPFDDPGAFLVMGISANPGLIFGPDDTDPSVVDQYTNQAVTEFSSMDYLSLIISPASSTQGAGLLVYRFRR